MNAYRITDWDSKYEVGPEGKPANEQTKRYRKSSLPFVRLKIFSESNGMAYRKLLRAAGKDAPAVLGFFCMFLEIAANRDRSFRGWLLDEQQKPLSAEDLAFEFGCENQIIEKTLAILTDERINWLQLSDLKTNDDSAVKLLYNETEIKQNITEQNETQQQEPKKQASGNLGNCLSDILLKAKDSSSLKNSSSSSDSATSVWDWNRAKYEWSLVMQRYFPHSKNINSDITTFYEMIKHLYEKHSPMTDELFAKASDLAKEAKSKPGIKNPLAYFVSRFKADFGDFTGK
jgi:hypothetical protein